MNSLPQTDTIGGQPDGLFHLATTGTLVPVNADELSGQRPDPLPDRVSDLPAFYYWKDAIIAGSYVHPAGRFSLDVTRDRLDGLVSTFNRMKENGVGVPILMDHAATASSTLGWIVDVRREGDKLLELHQFLGESARDIGLRNKVSLGIDPHFVDGKGIQYGEAIVHSAVTPIPVVPGQGEYLAVELSLASAKKVQSDECRVLNEEQPKPERPRVNLASLVSQVIAMKRDLALSRGGVDAAVAQEIFDLLVKPGDEMHLSRDGGGLPIAMAVFDALARNRPAVLGESTGLQVLSRSIPGDDGSLSDLRERMIALASSKS